MKSILYVMHISWGWIKQRPQFIAEELSKNFKIDVFYRKSNHLSKGLNPIIKDYNLIVRGFRELPLERISLLPLALSTSINKLIWKSHSIDWKNYDYIWVTDPILWHIIKPLKLPAKIKIIYDCMDDYSEFPYMKRYPRYKKYLEKNENNLLYSANFVICSSESLANKLKRKYDIKRQIHVVNNAITESIIHYPQNLIGLNVPENSLVYIGTVSEWLDYENMLRLLDLHDNLNIILYGPMRTSVFPQHPRLIFKGPIAHDKILSVMKQAKALIMPFIVNPLIESVNPVKIYEYAYSCKPIIATRYAETLKFSKYVNLYSSFEELNSFVSSILSDTIEIDDNKMIEFAMDNTWRKRADEIKNILHE